MRLKLLTSWLALICAPALAQDLSLNPDALLDRASRALQSTDFYGTLTYEFGSALETLEVVHKVDDGVEYERIRHLNGVDREFLRAGRRQDCVTVGSFLLRGGLLSPGSEPVNLNAHYHLSIRGGERLAGRDTVVLHAAPKDEYRYGMTLALDRETSIPLSSVITSQQTVLERFQFVTFVEGEWAAQTAVDPQSGRHKQFDGAGVHCADKPLEDVPFKAGWLPPGFLLSQADRRGSGAALTYTDGLSAFTVFVEPAPGATPPLTGVARRGASVALLGEVAVGGVAHQLILIGEVPVVTAQQVMAGFGPQAAD